MAQQDEQQDRPAPAALPIFSIDTDCPRCGYNLRELAEPRCPECGLVFQPHQVVRDITYRRHRWSLWSIAWGFYRDPVGFWAQFAVQPGSAAGRKLLQGLPFLGASPATMAEIGYQRLGGWQRLRVVLLASLWPFLVLLMLIPLAVATVHGAILWTASIIRRRAADPRAVAMVVGLSSLWLVPVLLCLLLWEPLVRHIADSLRHLPRWMALPAETIRLAVGSACLLLSAVSCVYWAAALYAGARRLLRATRLEAWLCVLCNPGWYGMLAVILRAIGKR